MEPRLYQEDPNFRMSPEEMSDAEYAKAITRMIIVCADVLFINPEHKTLYLAKRSVDPWPGWWLIGGRINAGETAQEGIARKMKLETSLAVTPDRFQFLAMNRYVFTKRKQEPQEKGTDNLAYTFSLVLTPDERAVVAVNLDPHEYDHSVGLREFSREALVTEKVHPAVLDLYDAVFGAGD